MHDYKLLKFQNFVLMLNIYVQFDNISSLEYILQSVQNIFYISDKHRYAASI